MLGWLLNLGFAGSGGAEIWSDASTNASVYSTVNDTETVWDSGSTDWDLVGNVYMTAWDIDDTTYSDASTNTPSYSNA